MDKKEREFNEIEGLIIIMEDWHKNWHGGFSRLAHMIQEAGYRKFPIDELKAWLKEIRNNWTKKYREHSAIYIQEVLDKIKELEDG